MSAIKVLFMFCLLLGWETFAKTESEHEKQVLKLIRTTMAQSTEIEIFHKTFKELIQKNNSLGAPQKAQIISSVEKQINRQMMESLFVPIYMKHYSLDDVKSLLNFYESPIGKKLLKIDPQVRRELAQVGAEYGKKVMSDIAMQVQLSQKPGPGPTPAPSPQPRQPTGK